MRFPQFFSIDNGKAYKAQGYGWLNAICYMAPAATAGVGNLCPASTAGCRALCLGEHSGQAALRLAGQDNSVTRSRKAKARFFMQERPAFMAEAALHIARTLRRARAAGQRLCVRMNGSTDIAWESVAFFVEPALARRLGVVSGRYTLPGLFGQVQFTDYTKIVRRALRAQTDPDWPANYHLTFSRSEANEDECTQVLAAGGNVAIVFGSAPPKRMWGGRTVINGDNHDLRHLDPERVVVGLKPKGWPAKRDKSGFVRP